MYTTNENNSGAYSKEQDIRHLAQGKLSANISRDCNS